MFSVHVPSHLNAINFFIFHSCCSYVGMYNCGQQGISLGRCNSMSNAVHEIGHVVGFWHEQSRPDRDQYVKVLFNNIIDGKLQCKLSVH